MAATATATATEPTRAERRVATFAVLSFWLCIFMGQAFALWWARRHDSLFVRRWAWLSLAMLGSVVAAQIAFVPFIVFFPRGSSIPLAVFALLWIGDAALHIATIPLAIRAWKGHDAASRWIPPPLARRLPAARDLR